MDYAKVKGFNDLTEKQKDLFIRTNKHHIGFVGLDYKKDKEPVAVWVDERNNVCAKLKDGDWYHYLENGTWY